MRKLLILPLLFVGSCVRQVPMETVSTDIEPIPPLTDGAPLVELDYGRFQILYDCVLGEPHRFTYTIGKDEGALERIDNFRVDQSLPEGCKGQISAKAYNSAPGFDRGHLAPANHFDDSRQAMNASNLMTNIVPQIATHNRYTWGMTETLTECYRDIRPVKIIGGVVFGNLPDALQNDYFVESHGIATPEAFWKVLLTEDEVGQPKVIARDVYRSGGSPDQLLARSVVLEDRLASFLALPLLDGTSRFRAARSLASLGFEHAQSVKHLVAAGLYISAAALLRVQYESLVRALWALYVASDNQAELMLAELTEETAKQASKIPMLSQMLEAIGEKVPHAPVAHLKEFKLYSWRPLSSFVHGGSMQ